MDDLHLIGVITDIFDEVQVSDTFKKKEFVIETSENYPQTFKIELTQDKINKIDPYKVGDSVKVQYNMRGRRYEKGEKVYFFISLNAWRITLEVEANPSAPTTQDPPSDDNGADELPF